MYSCYHHCVVPLPAWDLVLNSASCATVVFMGHCISEKDAELYLYSSETVAEGFKLLICDQAGLAENGGDPCIEFSSKLEPDSLADDIALLFAKVNNLEVKE